MNRNRNRGYKGTHSRGEKKVTTEANCGNSLVVNCFRGYAEELSNKHDRYERIVKQSRDITIESKRLIFLLHSVDLRKSDSDETLIEAFNRLMALCTTNFHNIAKEMFGHDHYQYARAYSAGLQEFIEALSFHNYLRNDNIYNWNDLQQKLTYKLDDQDSKNAENVENPENPENQNQNEKMNTTTVRIECLVQPYEFMLGLADLSGEIMRKCINSLGNGDVDACQSACSFIQELHSGYSLHSK